MKELNKTVSMSFGINPEKGHVKKAVMLAVLRELYPDGKLFEANWFVSDNDGKGDMELFSVRKEKYFWVIVCEYYREEFKNGDWHEVDHYNELHFSKSKNGFKAEEYEHFKV